MNSISENFKKHRLYSEFIEIKNRLKNYNFVCWVAGGAVRDFILDRGAADIDLVTDASTENLKILFPEAILVGESFGVLKIPTKDGGLIDLATFREESDYLDGRRPSKVAASTPLADSLRRDFTINSMFWDDEAGQLRDYQGGLSDLHMRKIKAVGAPETRFEEDKLRILRLVRFAAQLRFQIDLNTQEAAVKFISRLDQISGERIWVELKKIDESKNWGFIADNPIWRGVIEYLAGEKCDFDRLSALRRSSIPTLLVFVVLYPERDLQKILKERLKLSNSELEYYKDINWIMNYGQYLEPAELIFEFEKSPQRKSIFWNLSEYGLVPFGLFRNISELIKNIEPPWFEPKDILEIVPPQKIRDEMKFCRLAQLKKEIPTKDGCLDILRKKYAGKAEKP